MGTVKSSKMAAANGGQLSKQGLLSFMEALELTITENLQNLWIQLPTS